MKKYFLIFTLILSVCFAGCLKDNLSSALNENAKKVECVQAELLFMENYQDYKFTQLMKMGAYGQAKYLATFRLKNPHSAIFPHYDNIDITCREYEYNTICIRINSYVDTQNGFGAMTRLNYKYRVVFNAHTVEDISLEFDE